MEGHSTSTSTSTSQVLLKAEQRGRGYITVAGEEGLLPQQWPLPTQPGSLHSGKHFVFVLTSFSVYFCIYTHVFLSNCMCAEKGLLFSDNDCQPSLLQSLILSAFKSDGSKIFSVGINWTC